MRKFVLITKTLASIITFVFTLEQVVWAAGSLPLKPKSNTEEQASGQALNLLRQREAAADAHVESLNTVLQVAQNSPQETSPNGTVYDRVMTDPYGHKSYYLNDLLVEKTTWGGSYILFSGHDAAGRPGTKSHYSSDGTLQFTETFEYDGNGVVLSRVQTYPDGREYHYNRYGKYDKIVYQDGRSVEYTYTPSQEFETISSYASSGALIYRWTYFYDDNDVYTGKRVEYSSGATSVRRRIWP